MPLLICPNCEEGMREIERHGVRIDVCPRCRGVWLDRGELEKLLDAAAAPPSGEATLGRPSGPPPSRDRFLPGKRKRRSFLDDLFDFDLFD